MKGHFKPKSNVVLRVAAARPAGNVLSEWLEANRAWLDPVPVIVWLEREHPKLMGGRNDIRELTAEEAQEALRLVRARLGARTRAYSPRKRKS